MGFLVFLTTILEIKVLYWNLWFNEEPLGCNGNFPLNNKFFEKKVLDYYLNIEMSFKQWKNGSFKNCLLKNYLGNQRNGSSLVSPWKLSFGNIIFKSVDLLTSFLTESQSASSEILFWYIFFKSMAMDRFL